MLDPEQVAEMKQKLVRLGRRLAAHPGYRRIPAPGGEVNMRRTVRQAMSTGGIPVALCYQKRQLTRPEVLILCDLSGSVAPYCKFMLTLVYAMQEKFKLEDSILRTYAPYCHKIFECRNLRQLETAIRRLWNCHASCIR